MVTGLDDADRGQVLLVGAVVVALAIVLLVVVVNTAITTDTATGGSVGPQDTVAEFEYEATRNVARLSIRTAHTGNYTNSGAVAGDLRAAVENYSDVLATAYVSGGAGYASTSVSGVESNGTRIRQPTDERLVNTTNAQNWTVVDGTTRLGWFVLNLNTTRTSVGSPIVIRAATTSDAGNVTVVRNESLDAVQVESTVGDSTTSARCAPNGGRVALDLLSGDGVSSDCSVVGFRALDGNLTELRIENGDEAIGKYEVVIADASAATVPVCSGATPCRGPVPWTVTVRTTYATDALDYRRNVSVDVYGVS